MFRFSASDTGKETTTASPYMFEDALWKEHATFLDNEAIVVSLGYPQYYLKGHIWLWNIVSHAVNAANVVITDLDISVYEVIYTLLMY